MSKKSVLDKINPIGTLQKRKKEIEELKNESKNAIERLQNVTLDADFYNLKENQEISTLGLGEKKKLEPLLKLLIEWVNSELADSRVIVKDIEEDLYDGHILKMLIEKLSGTKLSENKLLLGETTQKQTLKLILDYINNTLNINSNTSKWTVESIYNKELVAILHLLVAIIKYFKVQINLPENLSVNVIVVKKGKTLEKKTIVEQITDDDSNAAKRERDAFDTLVDFAPEKLDLVKTSLLTFLNKHLKKIKMEINDINSELNDGVKLIMIMGLLENYYVPDYIYNPAPTTNEQKIENMRLLFDLMDDAQINEPICKPEDIVNGDLKALLRVAYTLFTKYRDRI